MADYALTGNYWPANYWPNYWPDTAMLFPSVNGGNLIHGCIQNWQRVIKRKNTDGSIDYQPYATLTWDIPQATMELYEELRALQGTVLTGLVATDIDHRNSARSYTSAEIIGAVAGQQVGRRVTGVRVTFRVKVS